jgi:serine protease
MILPFSQSCSANTTSSVIPLIELPVGYNNKPVPVVKDEIIVSFDTSIPEIVCETVFKEYGLLIRKHLLKRNLYLTSIPKVERIISFLKDRGITPCGEGTGILDMYRLLKKDKRFKCVDFNGIMKSSDITPNDRYYDYQWNINGDRYVEMQDTWGIECGSPSVIIAILDSGVAYENYNGYVKMADFENTTFVPGYDFINNDEHPDDDYNHGTHIAGIICSGLNNSIGIAGIAPGCAIMPVKILDNTGTGTVLSLIQGIDYAVEHGADVINLSVSFPVDYYPAGCLAQAVLDAHTAGVVLVAASGNDGLSRVTYPAAFNECIAVGAIVSRYIFLRANYSNFGDALDVVAPGGDQYDRTFDGYPDGILSTAFPTGNPSRPGYWFGYGTSQATAHVSALAGLLLSHGAANSDVVRNAILKKSMNLGWDSGWDKYTGYGLIDPGNTLLHYSSVSVTPYNNLKGFVQQNLTSSMITPAHTGLILKFPDDKSVCFLRYTDVLYALVDRDNKIACYELHGITIEEILLFPGGPVNYINNNGGIIAWLDDSGGLIAWINDSGGLIAWLDDSGGLIAWLNDSGNALGFIDNSGGLIAWIDDSGGIIAWINDSGGFIAWLDDSGGGSFTYFDETSWEYACCINLDGNPMDLLRGVSFEITDEFDME